MLKKNELENNLNISMERAEFVAKIFRLNGIRKNRIIIFDAKSSRPSGIQLDGGNKENRRVDINVLNE